MRALERVRVSPGKRGVECGVSITLFVGFGEGVPRTSCRSAVRSIARCAKALKETIISIYSKKNDRNRLLFFQLTARVAV